MCEQRFENSARGYKALAAASCTSYKACKTQQPKLPSALTQEKKHMFSAASCNKGCSPQQLISRE